MIGAQSSSSFSPSSINWFLSQNIKLHRGSSFCLRLTQLRCSSLTQQVQGHVQVSRQRSVICSVVKVPFCLLRCTPSPSGLSCSFALTELTGGLTVEFYHHPFSLPLLFLPLSHSLSLSLFSLASTGNLASLFSSVLSHR